MQLISAQKQKAIIVAIAAGASYLGLQAISLTIALYQIPTFLAVSLYVYLFLVFLQSFIFDLHLKPGSGRWTALRRRFHYLFDWHHWLHYQNYLILSGVIYWATVALIFLDPFNELLKQIWIVTSTLALTQAFWYLKTIFYEHHKCSHATRQLIFVVKLYASFIAFAAAFGILRFFGFSTLEYGLLVFAVSFLLYYQAMFQHHHTGFDTVKILLWVSTALGAAAFLVYLMWNVNFYSGALLLTMLYGTGWGLMHHSLIDRDLTKKMVWEYLSVLFIILVIIFGMTDFNQRI